MSSLLRTQRSSSSELAQVILAKTARSSKPSHASRMEIPQSSMFTRCMTPSTGASSVTRPTGETVTWGGCVSLTVTVVEHVPDCDESTLVAVNVTSEVPIGKKASCEVVVTWHLSVTVARPSYLPIPPSHSTTWGSGQLRVGAAQSPTITSVLHELLYEPVLTFRVSLIRPSG